MQRITSIGVLSLGKVMGLAGVLIGAVVGVLYAVGFGIAGLASGGEEAAALLAVACGACIGAPLVYGALCFVAGLLYALALNLVFRWAGGLELTIEGPPAEAGGP